MLVKESKGHPVQALRLCTGRTAHRGSRGIALPFHDHSTGRGEGQRHAPAALYPRERPGTHCTGGWMGPRAGPDRFGKSRPHQVSIPGPSSPYPVAIPTTLPGSQIIVECFIILRCDDDTLGNHLSNLTNPRFFRNVGKNGVMYPRRTQFSTARCEAVQDS